MLPSIFNIFIKQQVPQPAPLRTATLQKRQVDPLDCTLEKLDSGVAGRQARLGRLQTQRDQAAQEAVQLKRQGQNNAALAAAQRVRDCDAEIRQVTALMGRLKLETRQLNYAKDASDTNALIKEAVLQKNGLLLGMDVVDVEDTTDASRQADSGLEAIFDRLADPLEDAQMAGHENEQLLMALEQEARAQDHSTASSSINNGSTTASSTTSRASSSSSSMAAAQGRYNLDAALPF